MNTIRCNTCHNELSSDRDMYMYVSYKSCEPCVVITQAVKEINTRVGNMFDKERLKSLVCSLIDNQ